MKPGDKLFSWELVRDYNAERKKGSRVTVVRVHEYTVKKVGRKWITTTSRERICRETMLLGDSGFRHTKCYASRKEVDAAVADHEWLEKNRDRISRLFSYGNYIETPVSTWRRVAALLDEIEAERGAK